MPETGTPSGLANLPPVAMASSVGSLRLLQGWLQGPGRWAGWLIIPLVPLFIFTTALIGEVMAEPCYPAGHSFWDADGHDSACLQNVSLTMGAVSIIYVLLAAVCLGSAFATLRRPRSTLNATESAARLQGIKDWFIRGDIQEDDYRSLRQLIESAENPKGPGVTARRGATMLRSFAYVLLPLGVFWFFFIGIFIDEMLFRDDEMSYLLNWLLGSLLLVSLIVAALVRAHQLSRFGTDAGQALLKQIDAAEEAIMRAARGRTSATLPRASGASFRPYGGR